MPSAQANYEELGRLLREGKIPAEEKMSPMYFPRLAARRAIKNKEGRTRLIKEMDTPQTYSDFSAQFDRYIGIAGNPQIAFQIMLDVLKALPDESIKRLSES